MITARDLFFVLRARNEAQSVLSGVGRDLLKMGNSAQVAAARAQAASLRQTAANMKATGATKDQIRAVEQNAAAWDKHAKVLQASYVRHEQMANVLKGTATALTYVGLALIGAGAAGAYGLLSLAKDAQEYQRQVALTLTQTDGLGASLFELGRIGKVVGSQIAVPFDQIQSALYDIFSSTNATTNQAASLLGAFSKAAVAGQVDIQSAARNTMQLMNAFNIPLEDVNKVLDMQFQLVRKGVGTYEQFSNVTGRAVSSTVKAGQTLQQMDAMFIFLTRNGLSAAMSSASIARAMDLLANPKAVENLKQLGINVVDATGKFKPMNVVLEEMNQKWGKLTDPERAKMLSDAFKGAGGNIQAMRFYNLVLSQGGKNLQQYEGFLKDMMRSTGAFEQAYGTMANTTAAKTQLMKNNWQILKITIGETMTPVLGVLAGAIGLLLQKFNTMPSEVQRNIIIFFAIASALSIVVGFVLLVVGAFASLAATLAAAGLSIGAIIGIVFAVGVGLLALAGAAYAAYKDSKNLRDLFKNIADTLVDAWNNGIKPFAEGMWQTFETKVKPSLEHLWDVIQNKVVPVINDLVTAIRDKFLPKLKEAGEKIKQIADVVLPAISWAIENLLIPAIKKATKFYEDHKKGIDQVISVLGQVIKWVGIFAGAGVLGLLIGIIIAVSAYILAWVEVITHLVQWIGAVVNWIKQFVSWLFDLRGSVQHAAQMIKGEMVNALMNFANYMGSIPGKIASFVGNLGSTLWNAGKQVIDGLIGGIKSKLGELGNTLSNIAGFIASHKGPPEKDVKILYNAGRLVMRGLQNGIQDAIPGLKAQLIDVTKGLTTTVNATVRPEGPVVLGQNMGASKIVYVNTTINTSEIRPQRTADQLGFLIAGRV